MKNKQLLYTNSEYIRRSSLYSYASLYSIIAKFQSSKEIESKADTLTCILSNPELAEAIEFVSPSLYKTIRTIHSRPEKQIKHAFTSAYEYLLRMYSRATPFGILSSLEKLSFNDTMFSNKQFEIKPHVRLSGEFSAFLYNYIVEKLEKFPKVEITLNVAIKRTAKHYQLYIVGENAKFKAGDIALFNRSEVIDKIYKSLQLKGSLTLTELILVANTYNTTAEIVILLKELLKTRFLLLGNYAANSFNVKILDTINNSISYEKENIIPAFFHSIESEIKKFIETSSLDHYFSARNLAGKLGISDPFIVDEETHTNGPRSRSKLANLEQECNSFANLLAKISNSNKWSIEHSIISQYAERFLEKYGYNKAVPILQVFDEEVGLGSPYVDYKFTQADYSVLDKKNKFFRDTYVTETVGQKEWNIAESRALTENIPSGKFPESFRGFDLTFRAIILAGKETLLLGEAASSVTPSSFNGRFSFLETRQNNRKKTQIKGLRYTPSDKKLRNVFNNWSYSSKVAINGMASAGDLPLNEVYVLIDKDKQFVLFDKAGKKFKVDQFCMANTQREDDIVRFMLDVSNPLTVANTISNIKNIANDHSKRIVYNNIIIAPEKWIIQGNNGTDKQALINQLRNRTIPRQVSLVDFDMVIPLDISKNVDLDILKAYCDKHEIVVLSESFYTGPRLGVLDKKENVLTTEYTFTYERSPNFINETVQNEHMMLEHASFRNRFPFYNGTDGWLYVKIYIMVGLQNFFITQEIKSLLKHEKISKWFFIRYFDGREHLRLRIAPQEKQNLINKLFIWLNNLLQEGEISDYSFAPYERELERYGGENTASLSENVFVVDSNLVLKTLEDNELSFDKQHLIHVAIMFKVFSPMVDKKNEILSVFKVNSLHDKAGKREYDRLFSQIYDNLDTIIAPYVLEIEKLSLVLKTVFSKPNQFDTDMHTSEQAWISSIVHMHFNRAFGDIKLENLLRAQVFRLLKRKWRNL